MNKKELFIKLMLVCLAEEQGSAEHITEHVDSNDVINTLKEDNEIEFAKIFEQLQKAYRTTDSYKEVQKLTEKARRMSNPRKYEIADEIAEILKNTPIFTNEWKQKYHEIDGLEGKYKSCRLYDTRLSFELAEVNWSHDICEVKVEDLGNILEQLKP